jgi:hypothetical protein
MATARPSTPSGLRATMVRAFTGEQANGLVPVLTNGQEV